MMQAVNSSGPPWLSVIVPCRNERAYIESFCQAVLAQERPANFRVEVLIADGRSDDGTREWLQAFCERGAARDMEFVVLDNPHQSTSCALNVCIARARGDVLVRWDVHTTYAHDYLVQCVAVLQATGADNVGGAWKASGSLPMQQAIAAAFQSRWVAGGARSRDVRYDGPVDTVYLGCWPRSTFERFGGFDENLVRNQDDEHNLRLTKAGARIWQSSRIRSVYVPRERLGQLMRQYLQYGYWKPFVMKKHGQAASWRHVVPGLFVCTWLLLAALSLLGWAWPSAAWCRSLAVPALGLLSGLYGLIVGGLSLAVAAEAGWSLLPRLPVVIAVYHLSYGWGFLRGAWDAWVRGVANPEFGRLSR